MLLEKTSLIPNSESYSAPPTLIVLIRSAAAIIQKSIE